MIQRENMSVSILKDLKDELEDEAKRLNLSLSRLVEGALTQMLPYIKKTDGIFRSESELNP